RAVCLAPMGMEEGTTTDLPGEEMGLVVGEPVHFRLFASSARREDRPGDVVEDESELAETPPVEATVPADGRAPGEVVPVRLRAHVTEIGTLELECVDRGGKAWRLEWNLRQPPEGAPPPAEGDSAAAPA
ncbi:MAG TPA: Hsp70 family protein, partial [Anaeromyxobacter sp.]|nr:Hsp70 family protein [Anaeromyxobacter sp.]